MHGCEITRYNPNILFRAVVHSLFLTEIPFPVQNPVPSSPGLHGFPLNRQRGKDRLVANLAAGQLQCAHPSPLCSVFNAIFILALYQ